MRLALISHGPPGDPRHFSGITWHVLRELRRQGHEVEALYAEPTWSARRWAYFVHLASLSFTRQPHQPEADWWVLHSRSAILKQAIEEYAPDAVLCLGFPEAALAFPKDWPLYVWMDAFYPTVRKLYRYFREQYSARDARVLRHLEDKVLRHCRRIWLSSAWAAGEARQDFPTVADKLATLPFGANLENPPAGAAVEKSLAARDLAAPTFLFFAAEWERKGGDAAVATVAQLRAHGLPARLVLAGAQPPESAAREPWLEYVGRLDKQVPADAARLALLLQQSAIMLLPSTADCTPCVCAEAAAYGLPVAATRVGGLAAMVADGETGWLFPVDDFVTNTSAALPAVLADRPRYEAMARAARRRYEQTLNWPSSVRTLCAAIAQDLPSGHS